MWTPLADHALTLGWGGLGWKEIIIVLVVALLLFGGKKLPELARGLGRGMREFKEELTGTKRHIEEGLDTDLEKSESADSASASHTNDV